MVSSEELPQSNVTSDKLWDRTSALTTLHGAVHWKVHYSRLWPCLFGHVEQIKLDALGAHATGSWAEPLIDLDNFDPVLRSRNFPRLRDKRRRGHRPTSQAGAKVAWVRFTP